jgi:glutathione S-transferase
MKLYYSPGACSLSPHIVLNEAGLKHTLCKTDTREKTIEGGGDYTKINPLGYVPALELDDKTVLTEGPAIVQYIADQVPDKKLAPSQGSPQRYRLQSWLNFISTELHKNFSPLFSAEVPDGAKKFFKDRLATRFAYLDGHLAKNQYVMGNAFSVADAYAFTVLNWTQPLKIDLSPYSNIQSFQKRIGARPAVQTAMKVEGLIK